VKFRSRLFTALNLLPSMATLAIVSKLPAICLRNEALHRSPRRIIRRIIPGAAFSHTQGQKKPKIAGQQGDFTGLMFLRYLLRPPALPRSPDALPVGPSGRDAVGGGTIDQAEH